MTGSTVPVTRSSPFARLAPIYDAVYASGRKPYREEAARIVATVRDRLGPGRLTLLDVACGTGEHLRFLADHFDVAGLDRSPEMLAVARAKLPSIEYHEADMTDFALARPFDVVTCLFGSVGYLASEAELSRAVARMGGHLAPGGLLVLEPAVTPDRLQPPRRTVVEIVDDDRRIRRTTSARHEPSELVITFRFEIEGPDDATAFEEIHRIRLFEMTTYLDAVRSAGLEIVAERPWLLAVP